MITFRRGGSLLSGLPDQFSPGSWVSKAVVYISSGSPVFLTKNGRGRYVILDMEDYEKKEAAIKLMAELEKGRISGEKEGWQTLEEVRKELGLANA